MIRFLAIILMACTLSSCARMRVTGEFTDPNTLFEGKFSGAYRGKGRVFFTTDTGLPCEGRYRYDTDDKKTGKGSFTCLDRTTGEFTFVVTTTSDPIRNGAETTRRSGKGTGTTNKGQYFTFDLKG